MDYIITRKIHKCDYCERMIPSKSKMQLHQGRLPVYETDDSHGDIYGEGRQIGVEYYRGYTCFDDPLCRTKEELEAEKECNNNGHNFIEEMIPVSSYPEEGYDSTGVFYCERCNIKK